MSDPTILILGASRGIGLGLVRTFLERGWQVIASERSKSDELHALAEANPGKVRIVTIEVTDPASYGDLGLADGSLDALVINAGITGARHQSCEEATDKEVAQVMMTNAFGPARAAKTLLPKLRDGGALGFMSSLMGSIEDSSGGYELYRTSKCAQNMLAKGIAEQDANPRDIAVLSLHPGWVQTDMGGPNASITVETSVEGLADVLEQAEPGGYRYVDYTGKTLPF